MDCRDIEFSAEKSQQLRIPVKMNGHSGNK